MPGESIMEKELKELLKHIEENTKYLYPKDVSNETITQNIFSKGIQFLTKTSDQNVVDLCTMALVLRLRNKDITK